MWENILLITACFLTASFFSKKISYTESSKIKYHLFFFIFYLSCSLVSFFIWPVFLLKPKRVKNAKLAASILKHVTKLYELKWVLRNGDALSEDRGAVIVSNHQSSLDILGLFNVWEHVGKMTAIAKREIMYTGPFGLAAYLAGIVFIDRKNSKQAYDQLKVTSEVMIKHKTKIWVFPEGTRNKDYTSLLPFKKGAFHMAVAAQVPIIPVVFSPYYFINKEKGIFNKGQVIMQCLDPISTKNLGPEDVDELIEQVRNKMLAEYKDLSKEVVSNLPSDYPHTSVG